jgi:diguanylate cyclase (GGDEF)-like protein
LTPSSVRALLRDASHSLAARISFFVFAATLISALAVAWTSAQSLRAFLRSKVEQKVPATVAQLRDRLDLWYAQRTLDAQVFAHSETVVDGLTHLARSGREDPAGRAEVQQYLTYVLDGLPQYTSIFVLDERGRLLLDVGQTPELPADALRKLARVQDVALSDLLTGNAGHSVQVVSSVVRSAAGRRLFTLHAVLPLRVLEAELATGMPPGLGRSLLFDSADRLVAASRPVGPVVQEPSPRLRTAPSGSAVDYVTADGERVVGSAVELPRLHWTLVLEEDYEAAFAPIASILGRTAALNLVIVLVLSGIAFGVTASLVHPLHLLSDCARRLRDGEDGVQLPIVRSADEVGILARSFGEMVHSLQRANESLEQLAITDGLTKIHNHRYFQDQLLRQSQRADRTGLPLSLLLLDIDEFKALNDRHGHVVGDAVLERIAALLVEETRDEDLVARYGGEEFAILAPGTDAAGAVALAEKLRMAVSARLLDTPLADEPLAITVSIGVTTYRGDCKAFFQEADRALYGAKGAGRDCVVAYGEMRGA